MSSSTQDAAGGSADRVARIALTCLAEPGNRSVWSLVQSDGAPDTLQRLLSGDVPDAALKVSTSAKIDEFDPQRLAEATLKRAERLGARLVVPSDEEWPERVDELAALEIHTPGRVNTDTRPPLCLWVRGFWPLGETLRRSVAVVGARAATTYGLHVTTEIAYGLARHDWTVVSGGAFGIDAAAHRAALAAEGRTVAILACGVDRPYPAGNAALFERIAETGLLISEWPPGFEPLRHRFLIRNRLIAAATVGTVLTEAAVRSGATQTMDRALSLRRAAMVVPGPVTSAVSAGCHDLLRAHPQAVLVTGLPHVLQAIGHSDKPDAAASGPGRDRDSLDHESALVLQAVPRHGRVGPEQLAARAGLSLRTVLQRLTLLETAGLVERRDDGIALPSQHP